jgi:hypothetical protein
MSSVDDYVSMISESCDVADQSRRDTIFDIVKIIHNTNANQRPCRTSSLCDWKDCRMVVARPPS